VILEFEYGVDRVGVGVEFDVEVQFEFQVEIKKKSPKFFKKTIGAKVRRNIQAKNNGFYRKSRKSGGNFPDEMEISI
jgi:hypothetical protein